MAKNTTGKLEPEWPRGFPKPAERALATIGVTRLTQLTKYSEKELLALHGMGPKGVRILRSALKEKGLAFKQEKKKEERKPTCEN